MTKLNVESNNKKSTNDELATQSKDDIQRCSPNPQHVSSEVKKPTRQALQRHIDLIQRKRRKQMTLRKRVLIQEEFETNFVKLHTAECSESDSDDADSLDELFYQRKFSRRKAPKVMRIYNSVF